MMWLPNARSYGPSRGLADRLAERRLAYGFYPYRYMTESERLELINHGTETPPLVRDYLECSPPPPTSSWSFIAAKRRLKKPGKGLWGVIMRMFFRLEMRRRKG